MIHLSQSLPTAAELPCSDDTPVDNQLQNDIPNLLLDILRVIWADRRDWFWGVDMAIYADVQNPYRPVVPDGFLALDVIRQKDEGGRLSYVLWEEDYVLPQLFLEVVSNTYNGEYGSKLKNYQALGVPYYVIYNPLNHRRGLYSQHQRLEVYRLIDGQYQLQDRTETGIYWLESIRLGIGCERRAVGGWEREWLYWYNSEGIRYLTSEETTQKVLQERNHEQQARQQAEAIALHEQQARQQAEAIALHEQQARQQAEAIALHEQQENEKLKAYLQSLGVDPHTL